MRGDRVGRFTIVDHVARGSSADVYRATDANGDTIALKVLDRANDRTSEQAVLQALSHPGIVELIDAGTDGETNYLAVSWVEGRTLAHLLHTEGPLPLDRARRLLDQAADAVDAVHEAGFVHGDLSPKNMLVDLHDRLTLIDLGAASIPDPSVTIDETAAVEVTSTPRYAAPEVARGDAAGPASDRYALAVIAYEAVTGAFPFPDVATPIAMLAHHASTAPIAPTEHVPSLPQTIDDALLAGLAKNPADRPPTAGSFAEMLSSGSLTVGRSDTATASPRSIAAPLVAAALAAVVIIGGFLLLRDDATPATTAESDGWANGRAAGLVCNLLEVPGFEQGRLANGFFTADTSNAIALAPGAGVDGSAAVRIGTTGNYGLYAEMIPVTGGTDYVLTAWIRRQGDPATSGIYTNYLDADFAQVTDVDGPLLGPIEDVGDADGARITVNSQAPANAAWAIPTLFKDGSGGSLLVDEVLFGPINECPDVPS